MFPTEQMMVTEYNGVDVDVELVSTAAKGRRFLDYLGLKTRETTEHLLIRHKRVTPVPSIMALVGTVSMANIGTNKRQN